MMANGEERVKGRLMSACRGSRRVQKRTWEPWVMWFDSLTSFVWV